MNYPIFNNPKAYLNRRGGKPGVRWLKRWFEFRAIRRALAQADGIETVCDVPCGPGRLFPLWSDLGFEICGVDLSDDFLSAASDARSSLGLPGKIVKGDAFELSANIAPVDMVASVRFLYYFDRDQRLALLRELADASLRYVLTQYKTSETRKGRRNSTKPGRSQGVYGKRFCTYQEIEDEISEAGLVLRGIFPIAQSSDRVFVMTEVGARGATPAR